MLKSLFFPSALAFAAVRAAAGDPPPFKLGVQNVYTADHGAFTGENSAPMAKDAGADYVLVGHSERRHLFGDTNEDCARKCAIVERAGLTPLLCVGETLEQREAAKTSDIVTEQLRVGLSRLGQIELASLVVAYEPVWAIGTGRNATPEDAAETHGVLRAELRELMGDRADRVQHSCMAEASHPAMSRRFSLRTTWMEYSSAARASRSIAGCPSALPSLDLRATCTHFSSSSWYWSALS